MYFTDLRQLGRWRNLLYQLEDSRVQTHTCLGLWCTSPEKVLCAVRYYSVVPNTSLLQHIPMSSSDNPLESSSSQVVIHFRCFSKRAYAMVFQRSWWCRPASKACTICFWWKYHRQCSNAWCNHMTKCSSDCNCKWSYGWRSCHEGWEVQLCMDVHICIYCTPRCRVLADCVGGEICMNR